MPLFNNFILQLKSLATPQKVGGLEVKSVGSKIEYVFTIVEQRKKEVSILEHRDLSSIQELPKNIPICLTINTKDILHKKLTQNTDNPLETLKSDLPNIKLSDFYIQYFKNDSLSVASLIRKKVLDTLIGELNEIQIHPLQVSLAPFQLNSLASFFLSKKLETNRFELDFNEKELVNFKPKENEGHNQLKIGEDTIRLSKLISYATSLNYFLPVTTSHLDEFSEQKKEGLNQFRFKRIAIFCLSILFIILLSNFFIFSSRRSEYANLKAKNKGEMQLVAKKNQLKKEVDRKKDFLSQTGWLSVPMSSKFIDRIINTVPSSVNLTELSYQPIDLVASRKERQTIFQNELIILKGSCKRPTVLNNWLKELELLVFSKDVVVNDYQDNERSKLGEFEIIISL